MHKPYKSIQIGFENCEVVTINADHVKNIIISGIQDNLHQFNQENVISSMKTCDRLDIVLKPEADKNYEIDTNFADVYDEPYSLFDRLAGINRHYRDVATLSLMYADGSEETFYPPYRTFDEHDIINYAQSGKRLNQKHEDPIFHLSIVEETHTPNRNGVTQSCQDQQVN